MVVQGGPSGARALSVWRDLLRDFAAGRARGSGTSTARQLASKDDIQELLLHVAGAFDELITRGKLQTGRAEQTLLQLLLVRDYVAPLPAGATNMEPDFKAVIDALHKGNEMIRNMPRG